MSSEILVQLGRVVYVNYGEHSGKLGVVVDIVDGKRVVIDGPACGIPRQSISNKRFVLTRFRIPGVAKNEKHSALKSFKQEKSVGLQTQ